MSQEALAAKVKAVNQAHTHANQLALLLRTTFEPLVGHQITKCDGTLMAKVKKLMPAMPNTATLQVYRSTSVYSLAFTVKTCQMIAQTCTCLYYEVTFDVGDLDNGILSQLTGLCHHRTDYTAEEIQGKRDTYQAAKKIYNQAQSDLYPFGERDR